MPEELSKSDAGEQKKLNINKGDQAKLEEHHKADKRSIEAHKLLNNGQEPIKLDNETANQVISALVKIFEKRSQNVDKMHAQQIEFIENFAPKDEVVTSTSKEPDLVRAQRDLMHNGPKIVDPITVYMARGYDWSSERIEIAANELKANYRNYYQITQYMELQSSPQTNLGMAIRQMNSALRDYYDPTKFRDRDLQDLNLKSALRSITGITERSESNRDLFLSTRRFLMQLDLYTEEEYIPRRRPPM